MSFNEAKHLTEQRFSQKVNVSCQGFTQTTNYERISKISKVLTRLRLGALN